VFKGIDRVFDIWGRSRRAVSGRQLKSLAYCVDAVLDAAAEAQEAAIGGGPETRSARPVPFSRDELRRYLERNAGRVRGAAEKHRANHRELAVRLEEIGKRLEEALPLVDPPGALDLEDLERRLTVLEDKMTAVLFSDADEETLLAFRREMDRSLAAYRRKM
jgi:hypothetical protein